MNGMIRLLGNEKRAEEKRREGCEFRVPRSRTRRRGTRASYRNAARSSRYCRNKCGSRCFNSTLAIAWRRSRASGAGSGAGLAEGGGEETTAGSVDMTRLLSEWAGSRQRAAASNGVRTTQVSSRRLPAASRRLIRLAVAEFAEDDFTRHAEAFFRLGERELLGLVVGHGAGPMDLDRTVRVGGRE